MRKEDFEIFHLLEIDLTSMCNRDCWWCPRYTDRSGVRKNADGSKVNKKAPTDKVLSIIDQAAELGFRGSIDFHRMSEPFLDDRYMLFANYANSKGMFVKVNTNGDFLRNNLELCAEVNKVVKWMQIGIYDAPNEQAIAEEMKFWQARFPNVQFLCFSLPEKNLNVRQGSQHYETAFKDPIIQALPCNTMRGLRIRYDGAVSFCCDDDWNAFDLGNAFETPIKDIWWSEKHMILREALKEPGARQKFPFCSKCYLNGVPLRHRPGKAPMKGRPGASGKWLNKKL